MPAAGASSTGGASTAKITMPAAAEQPVIDLAQMPRASQSAPLPTSDSSVGGQVDPQVPVGQSTLHDRSSEVVSGVPAAGGRIGTACRPMETGREPAGRSPVTSRSTYGASAASNALRSPSSSSAVRWIESRISFAASRQRRG